LPHFGAILKKHHRIVHPYMMLDQDPKSGHQANRLLRGTEFRALLPSLEIVQLERREAVFDAGQPIRHVFFPHSAVICLMAGMQESSTAATATIGREGVIGFEVILGRTTAIHRALVQVSGSASRIGAQELAAAIRENVELRALLLRYIGALFVQVTQSVACNSLHRVEQRCSRWLLMAHDRAGRDRFGLTQEYLAEILGVHRPTVTIAACKLQRAGVIRYSRGVLTIVDRDGLENSACECYRIVKCAYESIFS
jgi:CRP-like cAMP-binding protein